MANTTTEKAVRQARVLSNEPIALGRDGPDYLLELALVPSFSAFPGQFVQIRVSQGPTAHQTVLDYDGSRLRPWDNVQGELKAKTPLLNRPFSIAGLHRSEDFTQVSIIYKVIGPGTNRLRSFTTSDNVTVLGPLGQVGFRLPSEVDRVVIAAGGLGVAGMLFWVDSLVAERVATTVLVGSPTAGELALPEPLRQAGSRVKPSQLPHVFAALVSACVDLRLATEDGSTGFKGSVVEALEPVLAGRPGSERWIVYGCGPWGMLKSIAAVTAREGLACEVSLEEMMACGIGACQGCAVKVHGRGVGQWQYKLCCTDGPVFSASEIVWEDNDDDQR